MDLYFFTMIEALEWHFEQDAEMPSPLATPMNPAFESIASSIASFEALPP
jgi:hypothetical protein